VHEGVQWRVWPSVIISDVGCRPVKVREIGPPRFFFHSQTGGFCVLPYAEASWETLAQLSDATLLGWLEQFVDRANQSEVGIGRL
jgi:hypothetical protein